MSNYLAFIILAFCFGIVFIGSAQEFSRAMPQIQGQELGYTNTYYPTYDSLAYWNYPYIPAKIAVQDAKESRLCLVASSRSQRTALDGQVPMLCLLAGPRIRLERA